MDLKSSSLWNACLCTKTMARFPLLLDGVRNPVLRYLSRKCVLLLSSGSFVSCFDHDYTALDWRVCGCCCCRSNSSRDLLSCTSRFFIAEWLVEISVYKKSSTVTHNLNACEAQWCWMKSALPSWSNLHLKLLVLSSSCFFQVDVSLTKGKYSWKITLLVLL